MFLSYPLPSPALPREHNPLTLAGPPDTQTTLPTRLHRALLILRTRRVTRIDRTLFWIAVLWLIAALCQA